MRTLTQIRVNMALLILLAFISSLHAQSVYDPNAPAPPPGTVELPGVSGAGDDGVRTLTGGVIVDREALNNLDLKPTTEIVYTPQLRATMKELGLTETQLMEMLNEQQGTGKSTAVTSGNSAVRGSQLKGRNTGVASGQGTSSSSSVGSGITRGSGLLGSTSTVRDSTRIGRTGIPSDEGLIGGTGPIRDSGILRERGIVRDRDLIGGAGIIRDSDLIGGTGTLRDTDRIGRTGGSNLMGAMGITRDTDLRRDPRLTTGGGLMQLVAESGGFPSGSVSAGSGVLRADGIGTVPSGIETVQGVGSRVPLGTSTREPFVLDELHKEIQDLISKVNKMHKDLFTKTLKLTDQEYAAEEAKIAIEERRLAELLQREKELAEMPGMSDPMGRPRDQADVAAMAAARQRESLNRQIQEIQRDNENVLRSLNAEAANRARKMGGFPTAPLDPRPLGPISPDRPLPPAPLDQRPQGTINRDAPIYPGPDGRLDDISSSARRVLNREIVRDGGVGPAIPDAPIDPRMPSDEIRRLERKRDALRRDYDRLQAQLQRRRFTNGPMQNYPRMDQRRQPILPMDRRRQPFSPIDQRRSDGRMGPFRPFPRMNRDRFAPIVPDRFRQQGYPANDPYFMYRGDMVSTGGSWPISDIRNRGTNTRTSSNQLPSTRENRVNEMTTSSTSPFSLGADVRDMRNSGVLPTYYMDPSDQSRPISSGFSSFSSGMISPGMGPYLPRSSVSSSSSPRFIRRTDSNPIFLRGASTINYLPGQTPRNRITF